MFPNINSVTADTVNADGSVTRVVTTTFDNGDTDVRTNTLTSEQYQIETLQLQDQINNLQAQLDALTTKQTTQLANVEVIKTNVASLKATPAIKA
jgi:hypothetical protein